jgi:hypothetical protein
LKPFFKKALEAMRRVGDKLDSEFCVTDVLCVCCFLANLRRD